jgi:hypothetical protein
MGKPLRFKPGKRLLAEESEVVNVEYRGQAYVVVVETLWFNGDVVVIRYRNPGDDRLLDEERIMQPSRRVYPASMAKRWVRRVGQYLYDDA